MWVSKLQANYDNFEQFEAYADIYRLHTRLGYKTAKAAWEANPIIKGSTNPAEFKRVDMPVIRRALHAYYANKEH